MKRIALTLTLTLMAACTTNQPEHPESAPSLAQGVTKADLEQKVASFAPARIDFDASVLEPWEKDVLEKLVQATDLIDQIYMLQTSPRDLEWQRALAARRDTGEGDVAYRYFRIMGGPWDRLEDDAPFLAVGAKPLGAGFYPPDATRDEIDAWLKQHPEDRQQFTNYFTVIRRDHGMLVSIPYATEYRDRLEQAAKLLDEAADESKNETLSTYLRERAKSFLSNDYFPSDMAWMDIAGTHIEPTIGPYEVYEDRLFGYKAAFESFIAVADPQASAELDQLKSRMRSLEENLPIEDRYKNLDRGFESPIRVVDEVYTGGEARYGIQTIAYNLPNDERVRKAKGSKKVMLRNVSHAKFDKILTPIAETVLDPALADRIDFKPWFTNVLMHELAHGLGPGYVTTPSGERMMVSQALKERYSALEEAKADVTGLHDMTVLRDAGVYDEDFVDAAFIGHMADMFRAVRFGTGDAHGMANLLQFNYLWDKGAIRYDDASGTFSADVDSLIDANRALTHDILMLEANGDYDAAGAFIQKYGTMRPEMKDALARLTDVPVDVLPVFAVLEKMEKW